MKIKNVLAALTVLAFAWHTATGVAQTIVATGSGNWSSTTPDAPWPGGVVPSATETVEVDSPYNVTVDTNETAVNVQGSGSVTLAPGVTLTITADGPTVTGTLVATAVGSTVEFQGNPYSVASGTYYNLTLDGPYGTLYNYAGPINVLNTLTLGGEINVQVGGYPWTIGNLIIGPLSTFDCSVQAVTVTNNVTINGTLEDQAAQTTALDDSLGSVTVNAGGTWNLGNTTEWALSGSLTNDGGTITGYGYGSVTFTGPNGVITGSPVAMPVLAITGTTTIYTTVNLTYSPTLNGTIVFDLANPGQVTSQNTIYYNATLDVINSGGPLATGASYQLFSAPSYNAPYTFATVNLPTLAGGLSWANTLTANGTVAVTGSAGGGAPVLNLSNNGGLLTLTWDTTDFPGFTLQAQTNGVASGLNGNWYDTGGGSPYTISADPTQPAVFFRLVQP